MVYFYMRKVSVQTCAFQALTVIVSCAKLCVRVDQSASECEINKPTNLISPSWFWNICIARKGHVNRLHNTLNIYTTGKIPVIYTREKLNSCQFNNYLAMMRKWALQKLLKTPKSKFRRCLVTLVSANQILLNVPVFASQVTWSHLEYISQFKWYLIH
jgi:hypothetical protein